ncbi:hypothetical protein M3Y97_00812800 [Aphelenchoides bicaudatus]|nr:hypothetical protein M3Y97_00812800 [Aphelenchoides bicaudatus]
MKDFRMFGESDVPPHVANNSARDYDHLFKILLIGNSGVGKSSLLLRFADNIFQASYITTIGVDFKIRTINVNGKKVKLQIWDTAGQERFRTITSTYYRGTHGVIIVYDITSAESFRNVKKWSEEIDKNCDNIPTIIVGNKLDREDARVVQRSDGQMYADAKQIKFFETSAMNGENVDLIFSSLTRTILASAPANTTRTNGPRTGLRLTQESRNAERKKKSCCN